jgi:hypothetical protein
VNGTAARYLRFAEHEAAGRSALYEAFARHVAASPACLAFLARLPAARQQPNLLFAALRLVAGTPSSGAAFEAALERHGEAVAAVMRTRTTQTNEPGRCAALLPALAGIEAPLALIEVGASAGLCLLPDACGYDWSGCRLDGPTEDAPVLACGVTGAVPLPERLPQVVWRAGIDLNPLDVTRAEDVAWLECLVWPEHRARLERLRAALRIARRDPPRVVAGDLLKDLPALIAEAPRNATVVVFHTAVLAYVPEQSDRDAFADAMMASRAVWISNEAPGVFPAMARGLDPLRMDMFLLSRNGKPLAWSGPHGQSLDWL